MKFKLTCFYGGNIPGDVVEVDEAEGKRLVQVGAGSALPEAAAAPAAKPKVGK